MRSPCFLVASVAAFVLGACSGDPPKSPDASTRCTGMVYDTCASEHDCPAGPCQPFAAEMIQVCTQACSAGMPCPADSTGSPGTCNAMGVCKPTAANSCHL